MDDSEVGVVAMANDALAAGAMDNTVIVSSFWRAAERRRETRLD